MCGIFAAARGRHLAADRVLLRVAGVHHAFVVGAILGFGIVYAGIQAIHWGKPRHRRQLGRVTGAQRRDRYFMFNIIGRYSTIRDRWRLPPSTPYMVFYLTIRPWLVMKGSAPSGVDFGSGRRC